MEDLKYYEEMANQTLLAHERSTEFFVKYVPEMKEWEDCGISFSQFKHDYPFREMSREQVMQITGGNLPEAAFKEYTEMLNRNMGGPSNG